MAEGTRSKTATAEERLTAHDFKLIKIAEAITMSKNGVNLRFGTVDTRLQKLEHSLNEIKLLLEGLQPPKHSGDSVITKVGKMHRVETSELGSTNQTQFHNTPISGITPILPVS